MYRDTSNIMHSSLDYYLRYRCCRLLWIYFQNIFLSLTQLWSIQQAQQVQQLQYLPSFRRWVAMFYAFGHAERDESPAATSGAADDGWSAPRMVNHRGKRHMVTDRFCWVEIPIYIGGFLGFSRYPIQFWKRRIGGSSTHRIHVWYIYIYMLTLGVYWW